MKLNKQHLKALIKEVLTEQKKTTVIIEEPSVEEGRGKGKWNKRQKGQEISPTLRMVV